MAGPRASGGRTTRDNVEDSDETRSRRDDAPTLPSVSRDDSDEGWGDDTTRRDDEWYWRERPPHHE